MKILTTVTTTTEQEIDLAAIPVSQWPAVARDAARDVLTTHGRWRTIQSLPAEQRKQWLIERVEAALALTIDTF